MTPGGNEVERAMKIIITNDDNALIRIMLIMLRRESVRKYVKLIE